MPIADRRLPNEENARKRIIRAGWVAPMEGPPIRDGAVVFERGVILDVGAARDIAARYPGAAVADRSGETLLPGLINAHTHLELSEFACEVPPASFVDWVLGLVPRGPMNLEAIRQSVARLVPIGIAQCLRFGVTCVGDISRHCTVSRPLLQNGPLRVVSYGEVLAMGQRRAFLDERIVMATDDRFESRWLRTAITPHAPYSVEMDGYRRCVEAARSRAMPIATHLAETPDEAPFLADHSGPFRRLWDALNAWDEDIPRWVGGPIRFAEAVGLLGYPRTLLAHVNYCDDTELEILARGRASVVYCPRTHAFFGHPPHRWRDMLARGINVAVGTDSCASSPDLNLADELRLLRRLAPDLSGDVIWKMATVNAAKAVDMEGRIGILRSGAFADFVLFPGVDERPLASILDQGTAAREVWIDGIVVRSATGNGAPGTKPQAII
ncbi:MAG TPA: amidohydrolase family protein [Tepidisphaeraceae bacterium]|jgi:cytosine/adenosine deaminase-related metal-dependent hydrolase